MSKVCYVRQNGAMLYIKFRTDDDFYEILDALKAAAPVHFDKPSREWLVMALHGDAISDWAYAHFAAHEIHWDPPRRADSRRHSSGQQSSHQRSSGHQNGRKPPGTREDAYAVLHLLPTAPDELVTSAYRVLAKRSHPDAGGSHAAMVALNNAYDTITRSKG